MDTTSMRAPTPAQRAMGRLQNRRQGRPQRWLAGLCLAAAAWLPLPAAALGADPGVDWRSADSAHFRVHYRGGQRAQAEQVAQAAERAYARISPTLQWQPGGRIELVVYSEFDLANGFSTPLPFNRVGAFLAPPEGELLDNSPWLDLLLTHELVHAIQLDKVRGAPNVLRMIFGRIAWFFPNLFMPSWAHEGLATVHEGAQDGGVAAAAALGRGRLYGPHFEGWLRAQQARGFPALAELNADGRALPLAKSYLYGGYFFDFLARQYGPQAAAAFVENYSGNIVPRFHTNPRELTGQTMDALWEAFRTDLDRQVTRRAAALRAQPERLGPALGPVQFDIASVAGLPDGRTLALSDDGLGARRLLRFEPDGRSQVLATLDGAYGRLDANARGEVLLTQADLCHDHYLAYDVYRVDPRDGGVQRLTHCAHLRRATSLGERILAIQLQAGRTRLVGLDRDGGGLQPLYTPPEGIDLLDLAATPDGRAVQLIQRRAGEYQLVELPLAAGALAEGGSPRLRLSSNAPMHGLRHGAQGPEFILATDGVTNVWRLAGERLQRLTHSHTGVLVQAGTQGDGALATVVIAADGARLHRLADTAALQDLPLEGGLRLQVAGAGWARPAPAADRGAATAPATGAAPATPAAPAGSAAAARSTASPSTDPAGDGPRTTGLGTDRRYTPLASMWPRSWWPLITSDRGLTAYGASTHGADALGWHQWALSLQWESSQREALGSVEYLWRNQHLLALQRSLGAQSWRRLDDDYETLAYERRTQGQWISLLPLHQRLARRLHVGLGAALDRIEIVETEPAARRTSRDERLAALLLDYDSRAGNWWSEGSNRGLRATLLHENHRPFLSDAERAAGTGLDGRVTRLDLRGFVPLGRSVLALRHSEARASGRTRAFQLGGATDDALQLGYALNSRDVSLRGYRGDEPGLRGQSMRVSSIEWRAPIADVDWHGMVPPVGLNRLSGAAFFDIGGAWNPGASGPARYSRGVGLELLGEVRLLYALGLQLRVGVARGLDAPKDTVGYLRAGRAF